MILQLQCQICEEIIATFDSQRMRLPLVASMFQPKEAGFDDPFFPPEQGWQELKCGYCTNNPFIVTEEIAAAWVEGKGQGPEILKTPKGDYNVREQMLYTREGVKIHLGQTKKIEKENVEKDAPDLIESFKCKVCGKPFKSQNALNSHSKKHKTQTEKVANG